MHDRRQRLRGSGGAPWKQRGCSKRHAAAAQAVSDGGQEQDEGAQRRRPREKGGGGELLTGNDACRQRWRRYGARTSEASPLTM